MPKADSALERVQNLYILQTKLLHLLEEDLSDPSVRKEVRTDLKEFEKLLRRVDQRYMGGEDVLETLKMIPKAMQKKLGKRTASVRNMKKPAKRRK